MKLNWNYSLESESKRLVHIAHQLSLRFYQINSFIVLPEEVKDLPDNAIIFPHLDYHKISRFFDKTRKVNVDRPIETSDLTDKLTKLLIDGGYSSVSDPRSQKLESLWNSRFESIIEAISDIIPDTEKLLSSLTIHPTRFGSRHSFNRLTRTHRDLEIYIRFDATLATITESITSSLTRQFIFDNLSATWSEAEIIPDWLLTQSKLANIVGDGYIPTVNSLRGHNVQSHKIISDKYLAKLGFPHTSHLLTLKDGEILFEERPLQNLSVLQKTVLSKLISSGNLSTDELADIIFSDDDKYSLYAIAKFIQRLRDKLETNGLTGSVIQTIRGYGYTMKV